MSQRDLLNLPPLRADKKFIDSVNKRIEKLIHLCQNPRLHLRSSPPYLLDILPDMCQKLKAISTAHRNSLEELFSTLYFRIFLNNLTKKCKATCALFKDAKELIFDERSDYRRKLTKNSLMFSHILKDLDALYPNNRFSPETFRITKTEAAKWWVDNFNSSPIVPWQIFQTALFTTFQVHDSSQLNSLQSTIDLTCNDHVSIFEFDVFVRLFQPWNNAIETWRALVVLHAGYMAFMTYDEVKAVLKRFRHHPGAGSYVYRLSCTKLGQWAIGYITDDLRILQTIIQNKSLAQALIDGERDGFYIFPNGTHNQSSILISLVENLPQTRFQISQEQYELYCRMGSTFELCKICAENNKDVRLEPCGHLLCKSCLVHCQHSTTGQTCPFCRLDIKSIEDIILDPYTPTALPAPASISPSFGYKISNPEDCVTNTHSSSMKSGSLHRLEDISSNLPKNKASQKSSSFSELPISFDISNRSNSLDFYSCDKLISSRESDDICCQKFHNGEVCTEVPSVVATTSFLNCIESCPSHNVSSTENKNPRCKTISCDRSSLNTHTRVPISHNCTISSNVTLEPIMSITDTPPPSQLSLSTFSSSNKSRDGTAFSTYDGSSDPLNISLPLDEKVNDFEGVFSSDCKLGCAEETSNASYLAGSVLIHDSQVKDADDSPCSDLKSTLVEAPFTIIYDVESLLCRDDMNINGFELTKDIAQQLLQITEGNYEMAVRIWKKFIPRSSLSNHNDDI